MSIKRKEIYETNRDTALKARFGLFWCEHCDHQIVRCGLKCPVCGHKSGKKRNKK